MPSLLDWLCPCFHAVVVRVPQGKALFLPKCLTKKSKKPGDATPRAAPAAPRGQRPPRQPRTPRRGGRGAETYPACPARGGPAPWGAPSPRLPFPGRGRRPHVRSNHARVVATAAGPPERVREDMRASARRGGNGSIPGGKDRRRWARHGRTLGRRTDEAVAGQPESVRNAPGEARGASERSAPRAPRRPRRLAVAACQPASPAAPGARLGRGVSA